MPRVVWFLIASLVVCGCSIKRMAINSMADSLAGSSDVYASDEDPELVREALPFALKTIESLLAQVPQHQGLLVSAASGFTQYAYAFVWLDAEEIENTDSVAAKQLRERARLLYLRARNYGLRALDVTEPDFSERINQDLDAVLKKMKQSDVPALYWTAVSWAAAVSQAKGNMDLVADLPAVDAMIRRALELQENYDSGAIHEFLISYESGRAGGSLEKAREHFARAMEINGGKKIAPLVSLAENISVQNQDRKEFLELLERALSFDVNSAEKNRLANLIAQKRARQLKARIEDLFLDNVEEQEESQ